jgi:hypothetical protein
MVKPGLLNQSDVTSMTAKTMAHAVRKFVVEIQTSYFNLGAVLSRVRDEGLFVDWEGVEYSEFAEWCEEVLKFRMRKAQHLIAIYKAITDLGPGPKLKQRLVDLGWVKVGQIIRVADTLTKLKKWVKIAEKISLRELQGKIRFEVETESGGDLDEQAANIAAQQVTRRFSLTEDQNALLDKALDVLSKRFPNQNAGEHLSMIVLGYMAAHVKDQEGGVDLELEYLIQHLERIYGVRLQVAGKKAKPAKKKKKKKAS